MTAQVKTLMKEASGSGKNDGIRVFKARKSILNGTKDNISLSVVIFKNFHHHLIFLTTLHSFGLKPHEEIRCLSPLP